MKLFGGTGVLGGVRGTKGYTIIEVMIFMVVSGGLLVSVLGSISGQQQKTRFQTGVRDFESQIQDMINDVETGYYPSNGDPGTTATKIFIGKGIQFYKSPATNGNTSYREITIQANAKVGSPPNQKDVTQLNDPGATIAGYGDSVNHELLNGIVSTGILYGTPGDKSYGVAIVSGISSDGKKSNGSRGQLAKLSIANSEISESFFRDTVIPSLASGSPVSDANDGVVFCLSEGKGGRVAAVSYGLAYQDSTHPRVPTGQKNISTTYFDKDAENLGCTNE